MRQRSDLRGRGLAFLLLLWLLWFMNIGARAVFSPILPLVEDEFAITHAQASSIFMFQSMGYGISLLVAGLYAGRLGYRRSITFCLALTSAVFFTIPFVHRFPTLYLLACISGFAVGIYLPSALPLITEYFVEKHWGKSIAIHDSAASFSIFTIPFLVLFLLHFVQWRGIFVVLALVLLACAIVFFIVCEEVRVVRPTAGMHAGLMKKRALWMMGTMWVFAAGANWGLYFTIPLYMTKELSLSISYANTVLGVSRLGGIAVAIMCGILVDRFSLRWVTFTLLLVTGVLTVAVGASPVRLVGVSLFLQVVFVTGFFPVGLVSIARMFDAESRSMATGIILAFSLIIGSGFIPYLLGLSGDLISFRFGFISLGVLVTLSSGLLFYLKELE